MSVISSIYGLGMSKKQAKEAAQKERRQKQNKRWSARPRAIGGTKYQNPKTS